MSCVAECDVPQSEVMPENVPPPSSRTRDSDEEFGPSSAAVSSSSGATALREGLPAGYRMLADRHDVDHMAAESVGLPVRLIPVDQIDATVVSALDRMTKSIAAHGILQPLLVRKCGVRYQLIAGRKRLASAISAGLTAVPCLLHDVSEVEAAMLAEAENVHHIPPDAEPPLACPVSLAAVLHEVATEVGALDRSTALLRSSRGFLYQKTAVDLIGAQSWRMSWLVHAATFLAGRPTHSSSPKMRPLVAVLDSVVRGCAPGLRLLGGELRTDVRTTAGSVAIDERAGELALTGALVATLSLLEGADQPVVDVRAQAGAGSHTVEIAQRHVTPSQEWIRAFSTPGPLIESHLVPGLAGSMLRALSDRHNGSVELRTPGEMGSAVRLKLYD
ncbi:MAG: hypothetical protein C5B57_03640 [Blastocatellia bacterium]|nr:MAG: hypothetical protein C5B57_03640 [Blastocatellia bacterium]